MHLLAILLCLGIVAALPSSYDSISMESEPIEIVRKNMGEVIPHAPVPNTIDIVEESMTEMQDDIPLSQLQSELEVLGGAEAEIDIDELLSILGLSPSIEDLSESDGLRRSSSEITPLSFTPAYNFNDNGEKSESEDRQAEQYKVDDFTGNILTAEVEELIGKSIEVILDEWGVDSNTDSRADSQDAASVDISSLPSIPDDGTDVSAAATGDAVWSSDEDGDDASDEDDDDDDGDGNVDSLRAADGNIASPYAVDDEAIWPSDEVDGDGGDDINSSADAAGDVASSYATNDDATSSSDEVDDGGDNVDSTTITAGDATYFDAATDAAIWSHDEDDADDDDDADYSATPTGDDISHAAGDAAMWSFTEDDEGDGEDEDDASDMGGDASAADEDDDDAYDNASSTDADGVVSYVSEENDDVFSNAADDGDDTHSFAANEMHSSATDLDIIKKRDEYSADEAEPTGECVPYYLCKNGDIITDGAGLIDMRFGGEGDQSRSSSQCPNFLDVFCRVPLSKPDPETVEELVDSEYVPSCGHRNSDGVGINLGGFQEGESQFAEFPWMAIILEDEEFADDVTIQRYVCGGSLIHPQVILTAAHCVSRKDVSKLTVRLGDWDTQNEKEILPHEEHRVARAEHHERFHSGNLRYDVALLFLEEPVELKQHIDTICLPEPNENFDYSSSVATGFGKDQFHGGRFQNIMKQVDLPVVPHRTCQNLLRGTRLGRWFRLHRTFTCAGGGTGVDVCRGDGGSPLACPSKEDPNKYVQVGIVAWGIGCGENGVPGVYASVPKLVKWVNRKMAEHFGDIRSASAHAMGYGGLPPV